MSISIEYITLTYNIDIYIYYEKARKKAKKRVKEREIECERKSERKRMYGNIIKLLFSLLLLYN